MSEKLVKGNIFFYNAIPMPHSILMHKKMVEAGYKVNFWYYKGLTTMYPWSTIDNEVHYYIFNKKPGDLKKIFAQFSSADFAVITGWHTYMHLLLIIWGTITRKKFALWIDIHLEEIGWIKKQRNTFMLKIATYLFVTGKNGFNIINKQYGISEKKMIDFPYLGAEFEEQLVKQINEDRKRQVESGANIRLLISNRFIERKGYAVILKMLHLINRDILNQFEISILGTGPELEFYKSSISALANKVHFYEWVEYDVYIQHVMRCDVYLHASLNEPFGIPPNDAMSCGKTVVASDGVISSAGRITTGINGFIYEKNNAAELAKILTQLANNRLEIYTIGERAFETAQMYAPSYNVHHMQSVL